MKKKGRKRRSWRDDARVRILAAIANSRFRAHHPPSDVVISRTPPSSDLHRYGTRMHTGTTLVHKIK